MSKKTSPYKRTKTKDYYLDVWVPINVQATPDDYLVTISADHHLRPDKLAYELYGTPNLFWVFAKRNMDVLKDPINDFRAGVQIYIPNSEVIGKLIN